MQKDSRLRFLLYFLGTDLSFYFDQVFQALLVQSYIILFFMSLALCCVIIVSSGYGFTRRAALDENAVQSAHTGFVPRVGGIAIYLSILGFIPLLNFGFIPITVFFELKIYDMILLILSASPIFFIGIAEDLGFPMSPQTRLLASAISSLVVIIIFKTWIYKLGIPGIDNLLLFAPVGIVFTIFATVGVVNAFNLIDGLNGLSGYVTVSIALSLSIIAFQVVNTQITIFLVLLSAAVLGFLVLNFPFGKIFLGDGGAYVLGHLLVWCSILIIKNEPEISPFSILLIFFWPVADTVLAIWRRWKLGNPADRPDRLHFHQLAMRLLEIRFFGRQGRTISNPLATLVLIPFITTPQILGVILWDNFSFTVWCTIFMVLLFMVTYVLGINWAKKARHNN